jgi:regulatory protein
VPERSTLNEAIRDLVQPDEVDRFSDPVEARKKAMDYLARREHSRAELRQKMVKAGFDPGVSDDAIAQLGADGLQDDRRYVEAFVQSRVNQGKGPIRIRAELGQRGIADSLLSDALADAEVDWSALARTTRVRKFGAGTPADYKEKARQMRFLQYRGFESRQIQAALGEIDDC